jgi:hypothetical protein
VAQAVTSGGELGGHARVHSVVVARVRLQLVPNQGRQELFVCDFLWRKTDT